MMMCPVGAIGFRMTEKVISLFLVVLDIFLGVLDQSHLE